MLVSEVFALSIVRSPGCILWYVNKHGPGTVCQSIAFAEQVEYYIH